MSEHKGSTGRFVSPEPVSDPSSIQNVLGFFQEYIPQTYSGQKNEKEKVLWARFESGDCNDVTMEHHHGLRDNSCLPLILFVGLSSGFSVWLITPGNDSKEVYSYCGDGDCTKMATLLKTPARCLGEDLFTGHRPLLAIVKKGKASLSRAISSTLLIISLSSPSTTTGSEVKRLEFERSSIMEVKSNRSVYRSTRDGSVLQVSASLDNQSVVVVVLQEKLVLLDAATLQQKWTVKTGHQALEYYTDPVALGARWLAYSDSKICSHHQSMGGVSDSLTPPVASTVVTTVKKGFAAISDTISGLTGRQQMTSQTANAEGSVMPNCLPVVTILDINYNHDREVRASDLRNCEGIVAHFPAHLGNDVCITALSFNNSGELLLTADSKGQCFNVFRILPGIQGSCDVHHLHSLYRGSTTGVVQDICFSNDSRWVVVSTLNGTSHVFPISPYGGDITVRTHTSSRVVNHLSRFQTSAGIAHGAIPRAAQVSLAPVPTDESYTTTTVLPLQQIKQPYASVNSIKTSGVPSSSISYQSNPTEEATTDNTCVRAVFACSSDAATCRNKLDFSEQCVSYSLYILGGDGCLVEHSLKPQKAINANDGEDAPVELIHEPKFCWRLLSKPMEDMILPLDSENPIILAHKLYKSSLDSVTSHNSREEEWLSQVELLTYAPPTRRLWMGPQFTFQTINKSSSNQVDETSSLTAVLPSSQDFTDLLDMTSLSMQSLKYTSPLSITQSPGTEREGCTEITFGSMPSSLDTGMDIFGSWNEGPKAKGEKDYEQQLLDAMKDGIHSSGDLHIK